MEDTKARLTKNYELLEPNNRTDNREPNICTRSRSSGAFSSVDIVVVGIFKTTFPKVGSTQWKGGKCILLKRSYCYGVRKQEELESTGLDE